MKDKQFNLEYLGICWANHPWVPSFIPAPGFRNLGAFFMPVCAHTSLAINLLLGLLREYGHIGTYIQPLKG